VKSWAFSELRLLHKCKCDSVVCVFTSNPAEPVLCGNLSISARLDAKDAINGEYRICHSAENLLICFRHRDICVPRGGTHPPNTDITTQSRSPGVCPVDAQFVLVRGPVSRLQGFKISPKLGRFSFPPGSAGTIRLRITVSETSPPFGRLDTVAAHFPLSGPPKRPF
jgi:hypothetical protein